MESTPANEANPQPEAVRSDDSQPMRDFDLNKRAVREPVELLDEGVDHDG
jgi:hypothetical protein